MKTTDIWKNLGGPQGYQAMGKKANLKVTYYILPFM